MATRKERRKTGRRGDGEILAAALVEHDLS
jgi:hypothetical protein